MIGRSGQHQHRDLLKGFRDRIDQMITRKDEKHTHIHLKEATDLLLIIVEGYQSEVADFGLIRSRTIYQLLKAQLLCVQYYQDGRRVGDEQVFVEMTTLAYEAIDYFLRKTE